MPEIFSLTQIIPFDNHCSYGKEGPKFCQFDAPTNNKGT